MTWISRLHLYAGLLTFVNLMLYAVVGIAALVDAGRAPQSIVWEQPFPLEAGQGQSDRAVAERVVGMLGLSLATPVHDFAIRHDAAGRLALDFYHANGRHQVTVLENPRRLRITQTRASVWKYLTTLHVTTGVFRSGDWRMQLWAWWNEFAMWCLGAMAISGVWIWWQRRRTGGAVRRAHRYVAWTAMALLGIYEVSAIQMAHRTWFSANALDRIHRMRGAGLSAGLGLALVVLGATGLWLGWRTGRERRAEAVLLGSGVVLAGGLIWWMRS